MTEHELIHLVDELRGYPSEQEWFEFKENRYEPEELGEYISALANSACFNSKPKGYLVFGIKDITHDIVGTSFDPYSEKGKGNQPLQLWLTIAMQPNIGFVIYPFEHTGKHLVLFEINAAFDRPVTFFGRAWIRIGECKTELARHPEREREIWNRKYRLDDWSAQICEKATLADLDPTAISKARVEYKNKYMSQTKEVDAWDDVTFLNKVKVMIQGRITNSALLLLGKPESSSLIAPVVARITWILKDEKNAEKDYHHFGPPFLLAVDAVFGKVRNLNIRHMPGGTLFPLETTQYDTWVLREALHNCIAHQDYSLKGRINVVETPSLMIFTNVGSFLPGSVEKVIRQDAPQEVYRNPFLAEAMVNLNMIDTQGGGIKKMFAAQVKRFFPLPDYDISNPDKVVVSIRGEIIDERYTNLLIARTDLDLWFAILLDKVQKKISIDREQYKQLKTLGAVEGRFPNIFVSGVISNAIGEKAQHIKNRGLEFRFYQQMIIELIETHQPVARDDIDGLLLDKLPEILSAKQKKARIHNFLSKLAKDGIIKNIGSRKKPEWVIVKK